MSAIANSASVLNSSAAVLNDASNEEAMKRQIQFVLNQTRVLVDQPSLLSDVDAKIQAMMEDVKFADIHSGLRNVDKLIARIKACQEGNAKADVQLECLGVHNLLSSVTARYTHLDSVSVSSVGQTYDIKSPMIMNLLREIGTSFYNPDRLASTILRDRININALETSTGRDNVVRAGPPLSLRCIGELKRLIETQQGRIINPIMDIFLRAGLDTNRIFKALGGTISFITYPIMTSGAEELNAICEVYKTIFQNGAKINNVPNVPNYLTTQQALAENSEIPAEFFKLILRESGLDVNLEYPLSGTQRQVNFLDNLLHQPVVDSKKLRLAVYYGSNVLRRPIDEDQVDEKQAVKNQDLSQALVLRKMVTNKYLAQMPDNIPPELNNITLDYYNNGEIGDDCCKQDPKVN